MKEIAPGSELRKWFSHDPVKWGEFARRYREELQGKAELVEKFRSEVRKGTVTILYSAKDE